MRFKTGSKGIRRTGFFLKNSVAVVCPTICALA